jgi:hypothetical protein
MSWTELLVAHRRRWLDAVLGEREVIDLDRAANPVQAIAEASPKAAIVWTEGFDRESEAELWDALRSAAARGSAVVIGVALADITERDAEALGRQLGEATVVTQQLAAASLMRTETGAASAVHLLVCANLDTSAANGAGIEPDVEAAPLVSGYVAQLERANQALREANVRLARERIGVHDSAAAAGEERRTTLTERVEQLQAERDHLHELLVISQATLLAPRYRAVDTARQLLFSIPGVSTLLDSRSRRLAGSGEWRKSAPGGDDSGTPG